MKFYDNVIVCAYKAYSNRGRAPYVKAINYTTVSQMMPIFLIMAVIKKMNGPDLFLYFPSTYYAGIICIFWSIVLYIYYPKKKVIILLEEFNNKSERARYYWGVISVLLSVIPIVGMILLFVRLH